MSGQKKIVGLWRDRTGTEDLPSEPAVTSSAETNEILDETSGSAPAAPERGWLDPLPEAEATQAVEIAEDTLLAPTPAGGSGRILASILIVAALAWIAIVGWIASAGGTKAPLLAEIPQLGLTLAGPLAILMLMWIAHLLSGKARADGFARVAASLRHENDALNQSVSALAAQLDTVRTAMKEQGQELTQFGLDAAARMHESSSSLAASATAISDANARIAQSGDTAMQRMEGLLAGLPRVDDVAQRLAENFAQAGRVAHQHGANLEAQLALLTERAGAADAAVLKLMEQLSGGFRGMESQVEKLCNTVSLRSDAAAAVQKRALGLIAKEQEAIEARVAMAMSSLQQLTEEARERLASGCETSVGDLEARLAAATEHSTALAARLAEHAGVAEQLVVSLGRAVDDVDQRLASLDHQVIERTSAIGSALSGIATTINGFTDQSARGQDEVQKLVTSTEALITALDAAAQELDETLPAAFARLDASASASRQLVGGISDHISANANNAAEVEARLAASQQLAGQVRTQLSDLQRGQMGELQSLQSGLAEAEAQLRALASEAGQQASNNASAMLAALADVREAAASAARDARQLVEAAVDEASATLRERAAGALDAALKSEIDTQLRSIEAAADRAVSAANGAADKLMRQLITIMDASASVEQRIADAETAIAATDRDTLAKQVVVLTDSLKSTAIDLTKILSSEVSDAAWDSYLKGDRGVFSRRAVRLIDKAEGREILRRYQEDDEFQRHVNRYIHDFEAILRALMGTRDGQSLSVTMLSSDVGKLYVALAQAIDRLRT